MITPMRVARTGVKVVAKNSVMCVAGGWDGQRSVEWRVIKP